MKSFVLGALAVMLTGAWVTKQAWPTRHVHRSQARTEPRWTLAAPGIRVVVESAPYALVVSDGSGHELLRSDDRDDGGPVAWTTGSLESTHTISPGWFRFAARLDPWRGHFVVVDAHLDENQLTTVLASARGGRPRVVVTHVVRASALRVEAHVENVAPRAWQVAFRAGAGEGFLGLGERFNATDQRGKLVPGWTEEGGIGRGERHSPGPANPYPNGEEMSHYPVPFFLSTHGYGFWLDTTYRSELDLAATRPDAWSARHFGPNLAYEIYTPTPGDARPWPYHIIDAFTRATGRPALPPAWAFGPRRRVNRDDLEDGVPELEALRALDLPVTSVDDALHFLPAGSHVGHEAELRAWTARARALGYRVNAYYNSFLSREARSALAAFAADGARRGYFLRRADGSFPDVWALTGTHVRPLWIVDLTAPAARAWFTETFTWALALGYSGFMYDFGEYVPADARAADGSSGEELHNLYPVLQAEAADAALGDDVLVFMRSGYTGASAHVGMVWSGDPASSFDPADGLPAAVRAGINLGVSGVPFWGSDIGGFHCIADGTGAADDELVVRWTELGALSPNMQDQDACVGGDERRKASVWNSAAVRDAWRTWARLHTRLAPYFWALAAQAHATGAPLVRHLFLEHPERPALAGVDDELYLGPSLLVAPVVERGARARQVRLPPGRYLELATRAVHDGDRTIDVAAPLAAMPLFLRAGGLVPLLDASIDTLAPEDDPDVVGPTDVAGELDVLAFVDPTSPRAALALADGGGTLAVTRDAQVTSASPALRAARDEAELSTCDGCILVDSLGDGGTRVRVSSRAASLEVPGARLEQGTGKRIRWDVLVMPR